MLGVGDDDRQSFLAYFDDPGLESHLLEAVAQPARCAQAVISPFGKRADRRDAQQRHQVFEILLAARAPPGERGIEERLRGRHQDLPRERLICAAWSCA